MIFHITRTLNIFRIDRAALKFVEQSLKRFAHHIGQHIQSATMRHAEHHFFDTEIAAALNDLLQCRYESFATIQAKTLRAGIFDIDKLLEPFCFNQFLENRLLAHIGKSHFLIGPFNALLQPGFFFRVGNMHELQCHCAAISAVQNIQHFANGGAFKPEHIIDENRPVIIGFGEPIGGRIKFRMRARRFNTQRVEIGRQMAAITIGADHHNGANTVQSSGAHRFNILPFKAGFNFAGQGLRRR